MLAVSTARDDGIESTSPVTRAIERTVSGDLSDEQRLTPRYSWLAGYRR